MQGEEPAIALTWSFTRDLRGDISRHLGLFAVVLELCTRVRNWTGKQRSSSFPHGPQILLQNKTYYFFLIRSALRFVCGIFVFGVTWILLRKSSQDNISPATWKQFMVSRLYKLIHLFIFVEFNVRHVCRLFGQSQDEAPRICERKHCGIVW